MFFETARSMGFVTNSVQTSHYMSTGQREPVSQAIQREVKSDQPRPEENYSAAGYPVEAIQSASQPAQPAPPHEVPAITTEAPLTEPGEPAENIDQGYVEPQPTVEVRKFSAPHMEWDATR